MKPNEAIYHIKQNRHFSELWKHLSRDKKEEVLRRPETKDADE